MKKVISLVLIFFCCTLLGGCNNRLNDEFKSPIHQETNNESNLVDNVINCFDEEDSEGLKKLFCQQTLEKTPDLDKQIESAMEFYEGKSVSHGAVIGNEGVTMDNGQVIRKDYNPQIPDLITDTEKKYYIVISSYVINTKYPEKVGVSKIKILSEDAVVEIGEYIY
ncbi:MAG: DUF5104 domain-containing protein [Oscillospiraceae bacterium]|nr:DUF5104 domain-containing protein [Oscillospiraceae bacterium]